MDKKLTGGAAAVVAALLYGGAELIGMGDRLEALEELHPEIAQEKANEAAEEVKPEKAEEEPEKADNVESADPAGE